jgi:ubiquinone/menaquinone biosynthesis C-methylase UbiE
MPPVEELYEIWSRDSELRARLDQSLEPRGVDWLFEAFAGLGPRTGDVVADVGARDAKHAIRLARDYGVRTVAIDPVPLHLELARAAVAEAGVDVDVVEGAAEALPLDDASVDWIWCRDVLVHVDVDRGLAEFARVLRPGGAVIAYVTLPTDELEPREAAALASALALTSVDAARLERAADDAGFVQWSVERLGSEWRERMIEDGAWDANAELLRIARLRRTRDDLADQYGADAVDAAWGGLTWGVYQMIGKLCPTIYVWERRA